MFKTVLDWLARGDSEGVVDMVLGEEFEALDDKRFLCWRNKDLCVTFCELWTKMDLYGPLHVIYGHPGLHKSNPGLENGVQSSSSPKKVLSPRPTLAHI